MTRRMILARIAFPFLLTVLPACGTGDGAGQTRNADAATGATPVSSEPRQWIILVDRSASRAPHMLGEGKGFIERLIDTIGYGDEIVLIEVHQGSATEAVQRWSGVVPPLEDPRFESATDRRRLESIRQGARAVVDEFFEGKPSLANTDLFSTLHVVAEYVRDANGRKPFLLILSDMLQSANGIEMHRLRRMPDKAWIDAQREAGLLPDLSGVCVGVIGADPTTREGATVQRFWIDFFAAAGARLDERNYRIVPPGAGEIRC